MNIGYAVLWRVGDEKKGAGLDGDRAKRGEPAANRPRDYDRKHRRGEQHRRGGGARGLGAEPEIAGRVVPRPGDNSPTVGDFLGRVTGRASGTRGVSVEVGDKHAAVDLTVTVP